MEKTYEVEICGDTPLLQNRFTGADELPLDGGKTKTKKKNETMRENRVEDTVYMCEDGKPYQPSDSIRQAMIEAGKQFKIGKATLSKIIGAFVVVEPEAMPLTPTEYIADRRAVVIPSTGGRVMRNRAKFMDWKIKFTVKTLDEAEIDGKQMQDVLAHAGKYIGIGDYRPQKKGQFGRFRVVSFREL